MIKYEQYMSEKEIGGLMDIYDRKRDGYITFVEFLRGLKPVK